MSRAAAAASGLAGGTAGAKSGAVGGVETSCLANGVRLVSHAMAHLETVSLGVWVAAGSRAEAEGEHGIAHFLEHMAFKGTATRSARQIAEEIEAVGGDLNAATSHETTAYYARVLKEDVPLALELLADIVQNPRFGPEDFDRERDVILQEIAASEDSPDDLAYDLAHALAWPGQALGRTILGTRESVRRFTPDDLRAYRARHYTAGNIVIAAAGGIDHETLSRHAEALFGGLNGGAVEGLRPARYAGGVARLARPFEQAHIILALHGPSYREEAFYTGQVLSGLFGGGMSSRLFQKAREERGLCYSIYSYGWGLSDTGLFEIHAATGPDMVGELMQVITGELVRIAAEAPSEDEVARAKAQLKAGLLMSLEHSAARAEQVARQLLAFGEPLEIEALKAKVDAVSPQAIRALAERLVRGAPATLAEVGGTVGEAELERMLAALS